jgi:hypothetical protein
MFQGTLCYFSVYAIFGEVLRMNMASTKMKKHNKNAGIFDLNNITLKAILMFY